MQAALTIPIIFKRYAVIITARKLARMQQIFQNNIMWN